MANLEDVFRVSGVPTHTYVTPDRHGEIKVAVRAPGRCVVLEGPSGIGKTTVITKILTELKFDNAPTVLSGRRKDDIEIIAELPAMRDFGTVIIDDFHRLPDEIKNSLSDYMKVLAETDDVTDKIILIGINKAGDQLVRYGRDLGLRIDIFRLEANSQEKILELIELGEATLNVKIAQKELIAERAQGSFQTAQLLCHKLCDCLLNELSQTEKLRWLQIKRQTTRSKSAPSDWLAASRRPAGQEQRAETAPGCF